MGRKNVSGWALVGIIAFLVVVIITAFTADMLPMIGGALGWIGGFFKSIHTASNNN